MKVLVRIISVILSEGEYLLSYSSSFVVSLVFYQTLDEQIHCLKRGWETTPHKEIVFAQMVTHIN